MYCEPDIMNSSINLTNTISIVDCTVRNNEMIESMKLEKTDAARKYLVQNQRNSHPPKTRRKIQNIIRPKIQRVVPQSNNSTNSSRIRNKYLDTIGINRFQAHKFSAKHVRSHTTPKSSIMIVQEPLRCGHEIDKRNDTISTIDESTPFQVASSPVLALKDRKVSFKTTVSILPIPTRFDYSDRIKAVLWSSHQEINLNMNRNKIEFSSENWDWRQAVEDREMIICVETGERIHPVHSTLAAYYSNCRQRDNFLLLSRMAAMQWQLR
uniref:Uncharacterized protein n=1 Tax=Ditylum brightwellii TaxID=49249 RepID=A0A6V2MXM8_9STRA|mmetsp:Transcript_32720/g.43626  ORF Transcript_32720/g.43626 Transcript_32720/m.43626 type:complete len:267 (+) Transcript_32720:26-826(+)